MDIFEKSFAFVLGAEGSWSGDPNDKGNWTGGKVLDGELRGTKYGISAAAYPDLDIANLTLIDAEAIYRTDYWAKIRGDELPPLLAMFAFDCAVNQGPSIAIRLLQDTFGTKADGIFGKRTMAAIQAAPVEQPALDFMARRAVAYVEMDAWLDYGHGWMARLFRLTAAALKTT